MLWAVIRLELADIEQAALCRRFGLAELEDPDGTRMLQRLTRKRVRRLEVRALRKLQASAHVEHLRDFLGPAAFGRCRGRLKEAIAGGSRAWRPLPRPPECRRAGSRS